MYREHTVGVVVPAYNEAGFVGDVIETLPEFVDRVYAVDDCSTDGTWAEIQRTAGVEPGSGGSGGASQSAGAPASSAASDSGAATGRATSSDGTGPLDGARSEVDLQGSHGTHASDEERASGASAGDELTDGSGGSAGILESGADAAGDAQSSALESGRDPGSSAGTGDDGRASSEQPAVQSDRVVPIQHEENRGVGGAIKTGYQRAREDGMDVTVVVGADGQMDPDRMSSLVDPIVEGKADYAKGNRLLDPDHHEEMPRHRVVGNGILTLLTKVATGYWQIGDPQMGYTAISLDALEGADVDGMYEYYGYCNDLLVRLSTAGFRVADVPCPLHYGDEESHISYSSYVPRVSSMLLGSFLRRLWSGKGSAAGATRLGLFVGGAAAVALGVLGVLVGTLRRAVGSGDAAGGEVGDATGARAGDAAGARTSDAADERAGDAAGGSADPAAGDSAASAGSAEGEGAFENGDELAFDVDLTGTDGREAVSDRRAADRHEVTDDEDAAEDSAATEAGDSSVAGRASDALDSAADSGGAVDDAVAETDAAADGTDSAERRAGVGCRSKLAIVGGVAALLGAMLVDATVNATKNYTDRLPAESE